MTDREGGTLLILTDKHLSLNHELLVYFRIKVSTWVKQNSTTLTTVELSRGTILKHGIETSWSVGNSLFKYMFCYYYDDNNNLKTI